MEIPPGNACQPRALGRVDALGAKQAGEYAQQSVYSSDHPLLSDTQVILSEFVLPSVSAPPDDGKLAEFRNGFTLYETNLPEYAKTGDSLPVTFSWGSAYDRHENYVQFLHFGHDESGEWWVYDQQPLGARLPTRLWYSGLVDSETWRVPLPVGLAPGEYSVFTGLYNVSDKDRVPASDVNGAPFVDARVPLGPLIIES